MRLLIYLQLIFLKDRKNEIGIYLSLGEKRSKIIFQIVTEVLVVTIVALTVALFLGTGIGTTLLATVLPIISIVRLNPKKIMI